jgi:hypothetical protein
MAVILGGKEAYWQDWPADADCGAGDLGWEEESVDAGPR